MNKEPAPFSLPVVEWIKRARSTLRAIEDDRDDIGDAIDDLNHALALLEGPKHE